MPTVITSHSQQDTPHASPPGAGPRSPWSTIVDAELARLKQWQAAGDLWAEQVAEQGAANLGAGLRLWRDTLVTGWHVGRQWQAASLEGWRRAAALLRR